jgi:hypothetical protein
MVVFLGSQKVRPWIPKKVLLDYPKTDNRYGLGYKSENWNAEFIWTSKISYDR